MEICSLPPCAGKRDEGKERRLLSGLGTGQYDPRLKRPYAREGEWNCSPLKRTQSWHFAYSPVLLWMISDSHASLVEARQMER